MPERNRQILLKRRPSGVPVPEDFDIVEAKLPEPGEGEVVLRGIYLSLDPYMRGRISGVRSYARPVAIGEVIEGRVVGQVVRSSDPAFRDGDYASGGYGWQLYSAVPASGLLKLDPAEAPISTALGILGMPGMTAYIGLKRHRPAQGGRDRRRLGRLGRGRRGRRAARQARGRARRRHRRRGGEMPLCRGGARLRCGGRPSRRSWRRARPRLPQRHRRLFRECRRRGATGGLPASQRFRPHGDVRHDREYNDRDTAARPQSRRGREQAPPDPGLHRQRPAPSLRRVPRHGGALGAQRPAQIPRGHRRRGWSTRPKRSSASCRARISASSWSGSATTQADKRHDKAGPARPKYKSFRDDGLGI